MNLEGADFCPIKGIMSGVRDDITGAVVDDVVIGMETDEECGIAELDGIAVDVTGLAVVGTVVEVDGITEVDGIVEVDGIAIVDISGIGTVYETGIVEDGVVKNGTGKCEIGNDDDGPTELPDDVRDDILDDTAVDVVLLFASIPDCNGTGLDAGN